jgi:hypothetical protein
MAPIPTCTVARSGIRSTNRAVMARSAGPGVDGGTSTSGAWCSHQPTTWETWSWLPPYVRGICGFISTKNGARPIMLAV